MRRTSITLAALSAALVAPSLIAQIPREAVFQRGLGDGIEFSEVTAVAWSSAGIAIVGPADPIVHVVPLSGPVREWGRIGEGPGEFASPADVAWVGDVLWTIDVGNHRLASWSADGRLRATRTLGPLWANRLEVIDTQLILGLFNPMGGGGAIVRLAGERLDTVVTLPASANRIRLAPENGPTFTLTPPFAPTTLWTTVPGLGIARWLPADPAIVVVDLSGEEVGRIPLPGGRFAPGEADREAWFVEKFPASWGGRRSPFAGAEALARKTVVFPEHFAPILGLAADPDGRLWVQRTTSGLGELWQQIDLSGRVVGQVRLPPGRVVKTFGQGVVIARAETELGEPVIEGYRVGTPR